MVPKRDSSEIHSHRSCFNHCGKVSSLRQSAKYTKQYAECFPIIWKGKLHAAEPDTINLTFFFFFQMNPKKFLCINLEAKIHILLSSD